MEYKPWNQFNKQIIFTPTHTTCQNPTRLEHGIRQESSISL